jgi:hypothetical protein
MMKRILKIAAIWFLAGSLPVHAQVAISGLPSATLPLAGTEVVPLVQSGVTKKAPASAFGGSTSANPTATIGASAVNGTAPTFMTSDSAPPLPATLPAVSGVNLTNLNASNLASGTVGAARLPLATTGAFGAVKPDGSTITVSAGVISAVGGGPGGSITTQDLLGNSVASTTTLIAGLGDTVSGSGGSATITHAQITTNGNTNFTSWGSPVTVRRVVFNTTLTASRTVTLPAASLLTVGQPLEIVDDGAIGVSGFCIIIAPAGTDDINGVNGSIQFCNANGAMQITKTATGRFVADLTNNVAAFTAPTHQFLTALGASGAFTAAQPAASDLSNGVSGTGAVCLASGSACSGGGGGPTLTTGSGSASPTGSSIIYVCTSTCSISLPTPAAGSQACVQNDAAVSTVITIATITGVFFQKAVAPGTANGYGSTGGTATSGGAVGDMICFVGRDTTHYLTPSFGGTWTFT